LQRAELMFAALRSLAATPEEGHRGGRRSAHPRGTGDHRATHHRPGGGSAPRGTGLNVVMTGRDIVAARRTEVVSDLRRATGVQHHGRTEPSATNAANARSPQHQRNLAVTNTANDDRKTLTRQGSLVRSQYRPPRFLIYIWVSSRSPETRVRYASELAAPAGV
jgi:hypothetical protein